MSNYTVDPGTTPSSPANSQAGRGFYFKVGNSWLVTRKALNWVLCQLRGCCTQPIRVTIPAGESGDFPISSDTWTDAGRGTWPKPVMVDKDGNYINMGWRYDIRKKPGFLYIKLGALPTSFEIDVII